MKAASFLKAISYRFLALATIAISFALTQEVNLSLSIALSISSENRTLLFTRKIWTDFLMSIDLNSLNAKAQHLSVDDVIRLALGEMGQVVCHHFIRAEDQ